LTSPIDVWIIEALYGMLYEYTQASAFTQVGAVSTDDAAAAFGAIFASFGVDMATTGVIVPFAGGVLPSDWLLCDGRSLAIADYPNLFGVIGTVWGSVDASHFNIPDLRGKVLVGTGTSPASGTVYPLGGQGGEESHTLVAGEMPSHSHLDTGHLHTTGNSLTGVAVTPGELPVLVPNPIPALTGSASANNQSSGGDGAHENRQPFAVVNYAIIT